MTHSKPCVSKIIIGIKNALTVKLGNLFSEKMIKDYLTPKNTVVYREFYNNIGKLIIDKSTQDNFKNLFENLIQKLDIKIDK